MKPQLWDMHIHLDFMRNARQVADDVAAVGLGLFAVTVTPQGFLDVQHKMQYAVNVKLAVGHTIRSPSLSDSSRISETPSISLSCTA